MQGYHVWFRKETIVQVTKETRQKKLKFSIDIAILAAYLVGHFITNVGTRTIFNSSNNNMKNTLSGIYHTISHLQVCIINKVIMTQIGFKYFYAKSIFINITK